MATYHNHLTAALAHERQDDIRRAAATQARRREALRRPRVRTPRHRPAWWSAVTARTA